MVVIFAFKFALADSITVDLTILSESLISIQGWWVVLALPFSFLEMGEARGFLRNDKKALEFLCVV